MIQHFHLTFYRTYHPLRFLFKFKKAKYMVEESTPVDISPLLYLLYTSSKLPQKVRQRATTNPNCTPNILGLMDEKASRASMLLCKRPSHRHIRKRTLRKTHILLQLGTHTQTNASAQRKCTSFAERTKCHWKWAGSMKSFEFEFKIF